MLATPSSANIINAVSALWKHRVESRDNAIVDQEEPNARGSLDIRHAMQTLFSQCQGFETEHLINSEPKSPARNSLHHLRPWQNNFILL
jgi:hypothetical protein